VITGLVDDLPNAAFEIGRCVQKNGSVSHPIVKGLTIYCAVLNRGQGEEFLGYIKLITSEHMQDRETSLDKTTKDGVPWTQGYHE
jgi:hypothetical protein